MYFFVKIHYRRPTFQMDMTAEEHGIMQQHVAYWSTYATQGVAIVFGPVLDPQGGYGIGVYQVQDEAEMRALLKGDPAYNLVYYTVLPMSRAVVGTPVVNDN